MGGQTEATRPRPHRPPPSRARWTHAPWARRWRVGGVEAVGRGDAQSAAQAGTMTALGNLGQGVATAFGG